MVLALRRKLDVFITALGILENFSFVIADHDFFVVVIKDVAGINWHLPAAAGGVDHILRNRIAGGVSAEAFDDLDPFRDRRAQVR